MQKNCAPLCGPGAPKSRKIGRPPGKSLGGKALSYLSGCGGRQETLYRAIRVDAVPDGVPAKRPSWWRQGMALVQNVDAEIAEVAETAADLEAEGAEAPEKEKDEEETPSGSTGGEGLVR